MTLDLVGKRHRTVYAVGCSEENSEDFVQFLMKRCGEVEAWDVAGDRVVVVFASMNSISTATMLSGISFMDLTRRVTIWRAEDPPPPEAASQLAIGAGAGPAETQTGTAPPEDAAAQQQQREERKRRRAAMQSILRAEGVSSVSASELVTPAAREAKMRELCNRQVAALCVLTEYEIQRVEKQLSLQEQ